MKANLGLPQHQFPAYYEIVKDLSYPYENAMWGELMHEDLLSDNMPSQDCDFYCMYMAADLI